MSPDSLRRIARTVMQGGAAIPLIIALIALLRSFGVPIAQDQEQAIITFVTTLGAFIFAVTAWNFVEDKLGKSILKSGVRKTSDTDLHP